MKILFTGATGVIGDEAIPLLTAGGHEVDAVVRSEHDARRLEATGAKPVSVDLFDRDAVSSVVAGVDAVVHMATAIPPNDRMTKRSSWRANDRLRADATRLLVDAAIDRGVERFVQQSISLVYADGGDRWLDEENAHVGPVWEVMDSALTAEREVGRLSAADGRGVVLRFASLYGPGRSSAAHLEAVVERKLPLVGDGRNYISRLHVRDAASAIGAALDAPAGTYNVAESHPARVKDELQLLTTLLGARAPRRVPRWVANGVVGPAARLLSISHRVSSARFRETTGWMPSVESAGDGWPDVIATSRRSDAGQAAVRR